MNRSKACHLRFNCLIPVFCALLWCSSWGLHQIYLILLTLFRILLNMYPLSNLDIHRQPWFPQPWIAGFPDLAETIPRSFIRSSKSVSEASSLLLACSNWAFRILISSAEFYFSCSLLVAILRSFKLLLTCLCTFKSNSLYRHSNIFIFSPFSCTKS